MIRIISNHPELKLDWYTKKFVDVFMGKVDTTRQLANVINHPSAIKMLSDPTHFSSLLGDAYGSLILPLLKTDSQEGLMTNGTELTKSSFFRRFTFPVLGIKSKMQGYVVNEHINTWDDLSKYLWRHREILERIYIRQGVDSDLVSVKEFYVAPRLNNKTINYVTHAKLHGESISTMSRRDNGLVFYMAEDTLLTEYFPPEYHAGLLDFVNLIVGKLKLDLAKVEAHFYRNGKIQLVSCSTMLPTSTHYQKEMQELLSFAMSNLLLYKYNRDTKKLLKRMNINNDH